MALTLLRGTQLMDGTLPVSKLVTGWDSSFLKKDGSTTPTADIPLGNFKITGLADAANAQDAVNLRTMQSYLNGIVAKPLVNLVATSNISLTGSGQTIDSGTASVGSIVLCTAQTTASQNGPWVVAAGAWTRPTWWAAASTQKPSLFIVEQGTLYHDTKWLTITDGNITVDTTSITITQDMSGISYTNGNGLSLTGNTFAVKNGNGIGFDGSQNVIVTPDANGLLSVGAGGVRISASASQAQLIVANGSNNPAWVSMSGDVTINNAGVTAVNNASGSGFMKYTNWVYNEVPTGAINGSNTSFTVANAPVNSSLMLFYNGLLLQGGAGNDYTISGTTISLLIPAPISGDKLLATYAK